MFKKLFIFLLAFATLLTPVYAANAQQTVNAYLESDEYIAVGEDFEINYSVTGDGVLATTGCITYDREKIDFKSATVDVSQWDLEVNDVEGVIYFASANNGKNTPIVKKTSVFTLTFMGSDLYDGDTITIYASELATSSTNGTINIADTQCSVTVGKPEKIDIPSNEDSEDNSSDSSEESDVSDDTNISDDNFVDSEVSDIESNTNDSDASNVKDDFDDESNDGDNIENELSDNNFLEKLIVKNAEITPAFNSENKNYEATVPFEIEELEVEAVAEDKNATVNISDTKLVYVGRNITRIQVISESGLKRTYKIYTTRNDKVKDALSQGNDLGVWLWVIISAAVLIVAATTIIIILLVKKRQKNKQV